jgi:hypothetical protein
MDYNLSDRTAEYANLQLREAGIVTATASHLLGHFAREDPEMLDYFMTARRISRPVQLLVKAAVAAGTTTDATWAGPLGLSQPMEAAFIGAVDREWTLPQLGAVRVPSANIVGATQTATATAYWVGEGSPKPLSTLGFAAMSLTPRKCVADLAVSEELLTLAVPDALRLVERSAVSATATALDVALLDPANSGTAGVKPASLTNGLTTIPPLLDFQNQVGQPLAAISGGAPRRPVLIVGLQTALRLSALPNIGQYVRVIVTPAATNKIIAVDADGVVFSDDGGTVLVGTPEVQMNDAPDATSTASTVMVSTWQRNLKVVRGERWVNWAKRADAVAYLTLA